MEKFLGKVVGFIATAFVFSLIGSLLIGGAGVVVGVVLAAVVTLSIESGG